VLESETAPVRLPVVDHEHAEILEGALEDAAAAVPSRAGGGERVEGIGAAGGADPVHAAEHVVERARRRDGDLRRVPNRCRHASESTGRHPARLGPVTEAGQPEQLGIWDGLPDSKPRVRLPVRGVEVTDSAVRAPRPAETIRGSSSYQDPHDVVLGHDSIVEISPETERAAYEHYGVEPLTERPGSVKVLRFRLWRVQSF
jgi:hypothetical protein